MRLMLESSQVSRQMLYPSSQVWIGNELVETGLEIVTIAASLLNSESLDGIFRNHFEIDRGPS